VPVRAGELNKPDKKPANGSSIAFVLEHAGRRCLFGADAHPDDLAAGLRRYEAGPGRIRFDAIKVPHHGAAGNCTSALIDLIESPVWLVSTSGARHNHPDPEAISRILLSTNEGKRLVFNYRSPCSGVWDGAEMQRRYNYQARYPGQEGTPMAVEF
jgi:hypothetical protein